LHFCVDDFQVISQGAKSLGQLRKRLRPGAVPKNEWHVPAPILNNEEADAEAQMPPLHQIKDRGGLLAPSADLRSCVNVCEQHRRAVSSLFTSRAVDQLLAKSLTDVVSRGLFANLPCDQAADENHRYFLLQKICQKYLFIRLAHSARTINLAAKSSVRQQLSKKIIFLGQ
jgi:hypothetical protein